MKLLRPLLRGQRIIPDGLERCNQLVEIAEKPVQRVQIIAFHSTGKGVFVNGILCRVWGIRQRETSQFYHFAH